MNIPPEVLSGPVASVRENEALRDFLSSATALENGLAGLSREINQDFYAVFRQTASALMPEFYRAYDAYLATMLEQEGKKITCTYGCSACCRHFVDSVEPFEIALIHAHIRAWEDYPDLLVAFHRRTELFEKIRGEELDKFDPETADDRSLYRYFLRGKSCPFLRSGGSCGIYAIRPMSCRMFFSEGSPRFCEGKAVASAWNRNFHQELPEAAERILARCSALLRRLEIPEGLFPGLLAANALWGRYDGKE